MAALQEPHPFSVHNSYLFDEIQGRLGDKAEIHYREWIIMPFWVGESGYEVVSVRWVDPPTTTDGAPEVRPERLELDP